MPGPPPNDALQELAAVLGESDTRAVVRTFLLDYPKQWNRLLSAPREDQRRLAHSLKSTTRHMGADALSRRFAALEARLARPEEALAPADTVEIEDEFARVEPALRFFAR